MMKMMILAPRRIGMTHEEFRRYVLEVHGPLVRSVPEVVAGILHYHYNFPVPGAADSAFGHPMASHLDIVTQGWFESREAQLRNMAEPRYLQIIRPDEGRFANEAAAVMHYTREAVIYDGPATLHKVFYLRRRQPSLTREAFQAAWRQRFPAALGAGLATLAGVSRYVQNHTYPEEELSQGHDRKYFDVIDEFHLLAPESFAAIARHPDILASVTACEHALLDTSRTRAFAATTIYNIP